MPVQAATPTAASDATAQLIALLLGQVKTLQAQLAALIATKEDSAVSVSLTSHEQYKEAVGPLLDELEDVQDEIDKIEITIEQKRCQRPNWIYSDGVRTFKCSDREDVIPVATTEVLDLEDDLATLKDKEENLNNKIAALKTRYGI